MSKSRFQSLGRDSVHSSSQRRRRLARSVVVSIPRSGFCSFKPADRARPGAEAATFQSLGRDSVHSSLQADGRLFIQASALHCQSGPRIEFQSLGRDSVHSSGCGALLPSGESPVSIPRSGFCSFKPLNPATVLAAMKGFNPSVGILFIQAATRKGRKYAYEMFQSLGRDSVHSSKSHCYPLARSSPSFNPSVGILFIQADVALQFNALLEDVSIPRSGFCSFKPLSTLPANFDHKFQSLGRDSVHSSAFHWKVTFINILFQSLGRDSVHSSFVLQARE